MSSKRCPACKSLNAPSYAYCFRCGHDLRAADLAAPGPAAPAAGAGFRWSWVGLSALLIIGASAVASMLVGFLVGVFQATAEEPYVTTVGGVVGIFLGGLVAGYRSPGVTTREPAVAAALVAVFAVLAQGHPEAALLGWIMPFLLAWCGAWLGEWLQGPSGA